MATTSTLAPLLSALYRFVLRILKGGVISQALARIFRRLLFYWSIFNSRCGRGGKKRRNSDPTPQPKDLGKESKARRDGEYPEKKNAWLGDDEHQFAVTVDLTGDIVSLDDEIAYSLYPFSGGGIRNASRSSQNLNASRTAHSRAISLRTASRSHLGTQSAASISNSILGTDDENPYTIVIQPTSPTSPSSPTPIRRYSTSLPDLTNSQNAPHTRHHHPLRLQIGDSGHRQPSQIIELSEVITSPQQMDTISLDIPSVSVTSTTHVCLDHRRIIPAMPEGTERYTKRPRIRQDYTTMTIQPLTTGYEKPVPPSGWTRYIHPEGARYFFHKEKRVYTDADLFDAKIHSQAMDDIQTLEAFITDNNITMPTDVDLVMNLYYNDEDLSLIQCFYYYVHHQSRTIFFLDTYEADSLPSWYEIAGIKNDVHLRHEIEAQYWFFLQLYPHSLVITKALCRELRDVVHHFIGDTMTSITSTAPYTLEDLNKIVTLVDSLEYNIDEYCVGSTSLFARLMYMFVHSRFLNFHGEAHARIERNVSVHGQPIHQRTWLIKSLSIFLFSSPDFHLRTLQDMWVDGIMHRSVWEESMKKMNDEWQEFVLFATVMLNANVAFLAIQSVDVNDDPHRSAAQISSYLSVVASVGSIVLGLLLIRQNRTKKRETVNEVQKFISQRNHPRLGLETLAILYSLPYAFLMWGMVSFLAAFLLMCLESSNAATRSIVSSLSFAVIMLVSWCVWTSWEEHPDDEAVEPSNAKSDVESLRRSTLQSRSLATTLFSRFWNMPAILTLRRSSYDSQHTAVNEHV